MSQKYDKYLENHRQAVKKAYQWIAAYIPELTDVEATRNIEFHDMIEMPYPYIIEMVCDWWAFSWIKGDLSEMFAWYKDHEAYIKLHNNTRSIVEEILEMIRTKLTEVENAEN